MILETILSTTLLIASSSSRMQTPPVTTIPTQLPIQLYQITTRNSPEIIMPNKPQYTIPHMRFVAQSFNNCGPASLSMIYDYYGTPVSQEVLASELRPFNNPQGGLDDKAVFAEEMVKDAQKYGYNAVFRPNGTEMLLKKLVANNIPIIVHAWMDDKEDIGHYKIVKGYDDQTREFILNDSFVGEDIRVSYEETMRLWRPFNYAYILIYPQEKEHIVTALLGENRDEQASWQKARERSKNELAIDDTDAIAQFNYAIASYHLNDMPQTIAYYDKAAEKIGERMLWYQPEPIFAFQKMGMDERAVALADTLLNDGNEAFSELYVLKGDIALKQGDTTAAKEFYNLAITYNHAYTPAKEALKKIN